MSPRKELSRADVTGCFNFMAFGLEHEFEHLQSVAVIFDEPDLPSPRPLAERRQAALGLAGRRRPVRLAPVKSRFNLERRMPLA